MNSHLFFWMLAMNGLLNKEFNNEKWWYLSNTHGDFNLICICNVGKTMP